MSILRKIFIVWNVLFLSLASVPRCATLFDLYVQLNDVLGDNAAEAVPMSCHDIDTDQESPAQITIHDVPKAGCRCMTDEFVKAMLPDNMLTVDDPAELPNTLNKNPYHSRFYLRVDLRDHLRPPILA